MAEEKKIVDNQVDIWTIGAKYQVCHELTVEMSRILI